MSRYQHQKSGLFLLELLINLLLFCLLCGCGLTFFLHSSCLITASTDLHHAVSMTSSIAGLYESGDGSFALLLETYQTSSLNGQTFELYLNEAYHSCEPAQASYLVQAKPTDTASEKIQIAFFKLPVNSDSYLATPTTKNKTAQLQETDATGDLIYSIEVCHISTPTLNSIQTK